MPSAARAITIFSPQHIALGEGSPDADHIAMAQRPEFQASGWLKVGSEYYSSVLVAPDLVAVTQSLTYSAPSTPVPISSYRVGFGSNALTDTTQYTVTQVIRPPGFDFTSFTNNVAFLKLNSPVAGVTPIGLYNGTLSVGQAVTAIGHGQGGSQAQGLLPYDSTERGMTNRIAPREHLLGWFPEATNWTMTTFDPDNDGYDSYHYDGGTMSFGDEGGGLYAQQNGQWRLAGLMMLELMGPNYDANTMYTDLTSMIAWIIEVSD